MIRRSSFRPAWWLPGPHLQTIWSSIFRRRLPLERRRERFELADGDFVDLDWVDVDDPQSPLVLILHGLTGSSDSNYAWGLQHALRGRGWRSVVMNFRGCSGEPNRLPRAYHSGETGDVDEVCAALMDREDRGPVAAVGYSLGGNVLLKWLGERGASSRLAAAVAVSVPYLLDQCQKRMDRGFSRVYRNRLIEQLQSGVRDKITHFEKQARHDHAEALRALGNVSSYRNFRDFDEFVTARLHGFLGADDYYQRSSSIHFLRDIRVPTLLLHAVNDPFTSRMAIPGPGDLSPSVTLELSGSGGHVGFVAGRNPLRPTYWLEQRIPDFLATHLEVPPEPPAPGPM